jgi:hypothetical protein
MPSAGKGVLLFKANAQNDITVAISPVKQVTKPMYEIVLGGWGNGGSAIRRESQGGILARRDVGFPSPGVLADYWVLIDQDRHLVSAGYGTQPGANVIINYTDNQFISDARYFSFSSWDHPVDYSNIESRDLQGVNIATPGPAQAGTYESHSDRGGYYAWSDDWVMPSAGKGVLLFKANAQNDIYVAISPAKQVTKPMYEIVLGGWGNSGSEIRRESRGGGAANRGLGFPSPGVLADYWVLIDRDRHLVSAGYGTQPGANVIINYTDDQFIGGARYFSFSSWDHPVDYSNIESRDLQGVNFATPGPAQAGTYESHSDHGGYYAWSDDWAMPSAGKGVLLFKANAQNDITVAISPVKQVTKPMYEIILGGWGNGGSGIRRASQGGILANRGLGFPSPGVSADYWVLIDRDRHLVSAGYGTQPGANVIINYTDDQFIGGARYFSFSSWDHPVDYSNIESRDLQGINIATPGPAQAGTYESHSDHGGYYAWSDDWAMPSAGKGVLLFKANAQNDITVAISPVKQVTKPMYEIVLGGWGNSGSAFRRASQGGILAKRDLGFPSPGVLADYWVLIDRDRHLVSAGYGSQPGANVLISYTDDQFIGGARYFSFSSWDHPVDYEEIRSGNLP